MIIMVGILECLRSFANKQCAADLLLYNRRRKGILLAVISFTNVKENQNSAQLFILYIHFVVFVSKMCLLIVCDDIRLWYDIFSYNKIVKWTAFVIGDIYLQILWVNFIVQQNTNFLLAFFLPGFFTTMKWSIHEKTMLSPSMKIITHEDKLIHSTVICPKKKIIFVWEWNCNGKLLSNYW